MNALIHMFAFFKHKHKLTVAFDPRHPYINEDHLIKCDWEDTYPGTEEDISNDLPAPLGNDVTPTYFVDASHGSNLLNRRPQTGILLFSNHALIHWYSKSQKTVESFPFSSEFIALKTVVEMSIAFRFKLRCFGVPIEGLANVFCDNETVCNNTRTPDSRLNKKHNAIAFNKLREIVAAHIIRVAHKSSVFFIADFCLNLLTKK